MSPENTGATLPLDGTIAQALVSLPGRLKNQSILRKALDGRLTATARSVAIARDKHRVVDGIAIPFPLYHSETWGYRMFSAADMERRTSCSTIAMIITGTSVATRLRRS
jgi:hypothetical protein